MSLLETDPPSGRRRFVKIAAALSGSAVFGRALSALAQSTASVTPAMIKEAEWISGLSFTDSERELMLNDINEAFADSAALRAVVLDNSVPPAFVVRPLGVPPAKAVSPGKEPAVTDITRPSSDDDLAFLPVRKLAALLAARKISSVELTKLSLNRISRLNPILKCVITETEELALQQAAQADKERAAGKVRGVLHGIPWGAKDLIAVPGYKTTWGSVPYKDQVRPEKATVVDRLEKAGAVLVAKTSVGELAWGDVWFGGTTKNPWKTDQGSSGSSAGSASGLAAGLFGFALGTETLGSIVSPSTRCGVTGLRPTFGRVSRHGVMALAWSMDKVGPMARTVDDCALVLDAIHGSDPLDSWASGAPFAWPHSRPLKELRAGFVRTLFEEDRAKGAKTEEERKFAAEWARNDAETLSVLRSLGIRLVEISLPSSLPVSALSQILTAEAAACFDGLTRSSRLGELVRQTADSWPNVFRQGNLIPAVTYLRAMRLRTLLMQQMEECVASVDAYVVPTYGGDHLLLTNLTGHPAVVVPNGFRSNGTPTSITFMGRLFGEAAVMTVARAYQEATGFHKQHPNLAF